MATHKLPTCPHLRFFMRSTVPFLSQASTCASEGLKGLGTRLPSGAGCECCAQACLLLHVVAWTAEAMLCCVKCWAWERWGWIKIKFLRVGTVGALCQ